MESEEHDVEIKAQRVIVNTGWTTNMAKWNTIGTVLGAFVGLASLILSLITLWMLLTRDTTIVPEHRISYSSKQ